MVEDVKIYLEEKYFIFLIKGFMDNTAKQEDKHVFNIVKETITIEKLDVVVIVVIVFGLYYFRSILFLFFLLLYSNYC